MTTDPMADAGTYYDELACQAEHMEQAEIAASIEFLKACAKGDANAIASFAPLTVDWELQQKRPFVHGAIMPMRTQTVSECMNDSLDLGSGPSIAELMQLVINVAFGTDSVNTPTQARDLVSRMASTWAAHNVEVTE
jgi:hypothetical protein